MTDFSNNASYMTDEPKHASTVSGEYKVYFTVILLVALPTCAVAWLWSALRHLELPEKNFIRMACSEAHSITPRLFWG